MQGNRFLTCLSLIRALMASSAPASAQDPAVERTPAAEVAGQATAPVVIDGVELFRVRGVTAFPAGQRAREIADRLRAFADNRAIPPESLTIREAPEGTYVDGGGRPLFAVLDADASLEGVSRQVLAAVYRTRVVDAVRAFRQARDPTVVSRNVLRALVATLLLVVGFSLAWRALRVLRAFADRKYRSRVRDVQLGTIDVVRGDRLWQLIQNGLGFLAFLAAAVSVYTWLNYVLLLFPWTRALGQSLAGALLRPLAAMAIGVIRFIPNLIFLVLIALVARYAMRLSKTFFRRIGDRSLTVQGFEPDWALPTERITRALIFVFAVILAYPYIPGSQSEAFKGIGLILGLMFSLGSPSVIGNTVAGLSLAFRRAFRVGDRVKIGDHLGDVSQVRLLTTYLRSVKNEEIVIPNQIILNTEVVNFTTLAADVGLILHTNVGIGYETPWRQVEAMLLEAAERTPGLRETPLPFVLQKKLGDFAVDYEINVYTDNTRAIGVTYTALHRNILDVFNEHGVQIMTPAYEGDPEQPKVVPREKWFASPAKPIVGDRVVENVVPSVPADARLDRGPDGEVDRSRPT